MSEEEQYDEATEPYRVDTEDLPDKLQGVEAMESVDKIIEYQSPYADFSVLLSESGTTQPVRVFYLEHLRNNWEWVDDSSGGCGFVLLKRRREQ